MNFNNVILEDMKDALGLDRESESFDTELLMHVNLNFAKLSQNGVGKAINISKTTTWDEIRDGSDNDYFVMVPSFLMMSVKLVFDPPPPSTAENYNRILEEALWRIKVAFDEGSQST